jgi:hypothetical protein
MELQSSKHLPNCSCGGCAIEAWQLLLRYKFAVANMTTLRRKQFPPLAPHGGQSGTRHGGYRQLRIFSYAVPLSTPKYYDLPWPALSQPGAQYAQL